jgi:hypothetical protein
LRRICRSSLRPASTGSPCSPRRLTPWSTFGSLGTYFGVRYADRPPGVSIALAMKKVKQSPRSDQPASWRSSKAAMRRSNVPRGRQEGAGGAVVGRADVRVRAPIQPPPQMRPSVLRAVPETGLRFVAQPRRHAGTGSRKGDCRGRAQRRSRGAACVFQATDLLQGQSLRGALSDEVWATSGVIVWRQDQPVPIFQQLAGSHPADCFCRMARP